jgi:GlpG protein
MRVILTSIDEDLSLFSQYLWQQRIRHRVFEERGQQILELADGQDQDRVLSAYAAWGDGRLVLETKPAVRKGSRGLQILRAYPGLVCLVGAALVLYPFTAPLAQGTLTAVAGWLTIVDFSASQGEVPGFADMLVQGEVWRWITPMFIHFNLVHLLFNCTIVIELGRRLEAEMGARWLWLVVLILAVASNLGQFAMNANPVFGGLSGVAYGLLGFVLVMDRLVPGRTAWHLPPGMSGSLLFFLVLFSTGVTEGFGLFVANSAHWFGLAAGAVAAAFYAKVIYAGH